MMFTGLEIESDEIEFSDKRILSHWEPGLMVSDFGRVKQLRAFIEKTEEELFMLKSNKSSLGEQILLEEYTLVAARKSLCKFERQLLESMIS